MLALNRPSMYGKDATLGTALQRAYGAMSPVSPAASSPMAPPQSQALALPGAPPAAPPPLAPPPQTAPAAPYAAQGASAALSPATQGATTPTAPAATPKSAMGKVQQHTEWIYQGMDPADQQDLKAYVAMLNALPQYKGSGDANRAAILLYKQQLLANRKNSGVLDDHAVAMLGDEYNGLDDQMTAQLAAMGIDGPALAGAHSNLRGKENMAVGNLLAQLTDQKRKEQLALQMQQLGFSQQMIQMAMQRYQQEHSGGGLLGDVLGIAGTIGGALIGGPAGAAIGHGVGSFAGGGSNSNGGGGYQYYDESQPWLGGT